MKDVCLKCAAELMAHYNELAEKHGDSPQGAQWTDLSTQVARFQVMMAIGDLSGAKVLDFGCGAGRLYDVLSECGFEGEYVGIDVAEACGLLQRHHYSFLGALNFIKGSTHGRRLHAFVSSKALNPSH